MDKMDVDPPLPSGSDAQSHQAPEQAARSSGEGGKNPSTIASCLEVVKRLYNFLIENKHVTDTTEDPDQNHATAPLEKAVEEATASTRASGIPPAVYDRAAVSASGITNIQSLATGKNVDPLFLFNAILTPLAGEVFGKAQKDDEMRLNSNVFFPKPVLSQQTIARYRGFVSETNIYVRVVNRLKQIFSTYDLDYVDEFGKYIPTSIYNKPIVKKAVINFLIGALADLFLFGYTVVGVPKDLIGWVERLTDSGVLNPALGTTNEHKVGPKAYNRMAQRTSSSILPYIHIDICEGELLQYYNANVGDPIYMFQPTSPAIVQLEKKFRTIVVTMPHKAPRDGCIQTGLTVAYTEWSRFRLSYASYLHAVKIQSQPIIVVNQSKANTDIAKADPKARDIIVNRLPDLSKLPAQEAQAALVDAMLGTGKENAKIIVGLAAQGMSQHRVVGSLTENRLAVASSRQTQYIGPGVPNLTSISDLTSEEHDKMELDALNVPRMIGEIRPECFLLAPVGTEVSNVTAPTPNREAVELAKKFFEETVERMLDLLIDPAVRSAVFDRSASSSGSATQIEVSHAEQAKTEITALSIAGEFFDEVYMEHGAILDQLGIVHVITRMQRILREYRIIKALQDYVRESAELVEVKFEELVDYMADPKIRNQLISIGSYGSVQRKNRNLATEETEVKSKRLMQLTLSTLKDWGKVAEHARGIEAMFLVSYRSLVEGNSTNLRLRFTKKKLDTGEDEEEGKDGKEGKGEGGGDSKAPSKKKKKSSSGDKKKSSASKEKKGASGGENKQTVVLEFKQPK